MNTQACNPWPYPVPTYPANPAPVYPSYGTGVTTYGWPLTEETVRKIIREELRLALAALKEETP